MRYTISLGSRGSAIERHPLAPNFVRPRGALNKRTREIMEAITEDGKLTPLEYLVSLYQDDDQPLAVRIDAAKAAAPFCHSKLSSVDLDMRPIDDRDIKELSDAELHRLIRENQADIEKEKKRLAEEDAHQS